MCGISAIFSKEALDENLIKEMNYQIKHRGPDNDGVLSIFNNKCLLGHRRLSIIDLNNQSNQPMSYGDYSIVFNGEIYNYIELKEELINNGYIFQTDSDTEVILAAYDKWKEKCIERFNGMWAFIILDKQNMKAFISRDRFGVKPLYYWWFNNGSGIAFGSEIKQFTVLPGWKAILNNQKAYEFLNWDILDHTNETLFKNVYQIQSGEYAICDLNTLNLYKNKWYSLPEEIEFNNKNVLKEFKARLLNSISLRLRSDVSIGACLSGGLDSSTIVSIVSKYFNSELKTFSSCSNIKQYDEKEYIDTVINKYNDIQPNFVFPQDKDLFEEIDNIIWFQDEPFCSTSVFAQWSVFKEAKDNNIKVMLDGQGADEILAGYHSFFYPHLVYLLKKKKIIKFFDECCNMKKLYGYGYFYIVKNILSMLLPQILRVYLRSIFGGKNLKPSWLSHKFVYSPKDPFFELGSKCTSVKQLSKAQLSGANLQKLLHWEDRDSMAHSVESRLPFLDFQFVEFVLRTDDCLKINQGHTKSILRKTMMNILPEKILNRTDKMGFVTPEQIWIINNLDKIISEIKNNNLAKKIFNIDEIVDDRFIKNKSNSNLLWKIFILLRWLKVYDVDVRNGGI